MSGNETRDPTELFYGSSNRKIQKFVLIKNLNRCQPILFDTFQLLRWILLSFYLLLDPFAPFNKICQYSYTFLFSQAKFSKHIALCRNVFELYRWKKSTIDNAIEERKTENRQISSLRHESSSLIEVTLQFCTTLLLTC